MVQNNVSYTEMSSSVGFQDGFSKGAQREFCNPQMYRSETFLWEIIAQLGWKKSHRPTHRAASDLTQCHMDALFGIMTQ